ncbi:MULTISPECIES: carboxymuconolactone decarboxylase family protein [unclassified Dietzia]|uniref:carboxymuconolactone decarboxylase family protein n=1 Tax=unclassified Dietzia TaxID=2617939 RepID=UPI000D21E993|nr:MULTISPECIES: carboxymuconolactone decarboxylase family protein [unclassified Dietzia]AVZ40394.1 4-carboxymuconolactone decarboxylase [Dietzia sp. JS16-p6b]MBB1022993.1 carboxymuconolactone decarboxylase family protein [Dietzia sp. DQ12-76]MBB1028084.1 carboxymuconolactone decarboxylase family protein [Dietzia sp. DQ11-38-2]QGW25890.1 alkylhydroperoxidase like protein [Dietzia sp. DQ12-45-1b]
MSQAHHTDSDPGDPGRPRIRPGGFRELGPVGWAVNRVGARVTGSRDVHLFATLGRARRLFPAWLAYSGMMMPFGVLDRRTTELVILRVAHLRDSAYERAHHERIGARVGLDDDEIARTLHDPRSAGWPNRLRAVLTAVDELVRTKDIADDTWAEVATHLTEAELVGLVQLVAQYDGLATTLHALRIQPDRPR